jgi:hypothetical protein
MIIINGGASVKDVPPFFFWGRRYRLQGKQFVTGYRFPVTGKYRVDAWQPETGNRKPET